MSKKKILIIEDDEDMCEEMKAFLEVEGFSVEISNDGRSGIVNAKNNNYNLILLDLKLPKMNGYEVLKVLKSEQPKTKIFVISGSPLEGSVFIEDETSIREKEYKESRLKLADGVINKPFKVESLFLKIKRLL